MTNLNSLDQKSIEKDYNIVQPAEEPDKLNDRSVTDILLVLFAIIPMISKRWNKYRILKEPASQA